MKKFIDDDFLLSTACARRLYHEAAAAEPLFDYHCHLNPRDIAEDKRFDDLSELWLSGDHYKWRAMRANGVDEAFITGGAEPVEKFFAWAGTVPRLVGNPLYHWTHLELRRCFGFDEPLCAENAKSVWEAANAALKTLPVSALFKKFNVFAVGTTDDPADDLRFHKMAGAAPTKVVPSFRPDRALGIEKDDFIEYLALLGGASGVNIGSFDDFLAALSASVERFDRAGCMASDHDIPAVFFEEPHSWVTWERGLAAVFDRRLSGRMPPEREVDSFKSFVLRFLSGEYRERGWAMQLHIGAMRSVNARMAAALGANSGYDAMGDDRVVSKLALLLGAIDGRGGLPKTILYGLNPKDMYPLSVLAGSFQGGLAGKIQLGSAWWFLDSRDGMEAQLKTLANTGLLSRFVGMTTDSRSFLSYPRHEYFRRILCNMIGAWAEEGEIPSDFAFLSGLVRDVSFGNALTYFCRGERRGA